MGKTTAVYIFDRKGGYQDELERQLDLAGIPRLAIEIPSFSWKARILKTRDVAAENPDIPLVFLDAWDTLLFGSSDELDSCCKTGAVIFSAQKKCWPKPELYIDYNKKQEMSRVSRWRYLNSNPMLGYGSDIAKMIDWGWERFPLSTDSATTLEPTGEVCERFYTDLYLKSGFDIRLDTMCQLNQCFLCSEPGELSVYTKRIRNEITGYFPVFLHLNGKIQLDLEIFK